MVAFTSIACRVTKSGSKADVRVSVAVDAYLELASCAAVPGGGRNREYAFHVLALCQGNLQVRSRRCPFPFFLSWF